MKYYARVENKIAYKLGLITAEKAMKPTHISGKEYTHEMFEIDRKSYENGSHGYGLNNNGKKVNVNGVLVPDKYVFVF
ncbi:hypothetical protein [Lactobacillus intestinalis]|uniref:hypothetical protein n=1 Tax=Lactobacillus intestinalis TaxID=151781 RepID=UPI0026EF35B2|nr:hypothetical protein [Lactobacillus intestinalis]